MSSRLSHLTSPTMIDHCSCRAAPAPIPMPPSSCPVRQQVRTVRVPWHAEHRDRRNFGLRKNLAFTPTKETWQTCPHPPFKNQKNQNISSQTVLAGLHFQAVVRSLAAQRGDSHLHRVQERWQVIEFLCFLALRRKTHLIFTRSRNEGVPHPPDMARLDKLSLSPGSAAVRLDPPAAHEFTKWDYVGVHGTTDAEKDRMLEWRDYLGVNGGTGDENYDMPEHSFHEDYLIDDDRITCVEFDQKGNFLGTGDEGGRIKVYRRDSPDKPFYKLHTRFDGHQEMHDFLESQSFSPKVRAMAFLPQPTPTTHQFLTASSNTIKLWKLKKARPAELRPRLRLGSSDSGAEGAAGARPAAEKREADVQVKMARFWEGFHSSHIHSLSLKSDQEIFLSSCQLMVNSLFVERPGVCQTLVESKSVNSAVITSAAFNPGSTDEFVFSTNTGALQLCDHRQGKALYLGTKSALSRS